MTSSPAPDVEYGECRVCGDLSLPVLTMAPCGHDEPPIVRHLTSPGVVYSWTRTGGAEPTLLAMVDFLDGALRAAAPVTGAESVAIGDLVVAAPGSATPLMFLPTESTDP
jgi:uncharacterized OB-fold protein